MPACYTYLLEIALLQCLKDKLKFASRFSVSRIRFGYNLFLIDLRQSICAQMKRFIEESIDSLAF